jgi:hypothetical protein
MGASETGASVGASVAGASVAGASVGAGGSVAGVPQEVTSMLITRMLIRTNQILDLIIVSSWLSSNISIYTLMQTFNIILYAFTSFPLVKFYGR